MRRSLDGGDTWTRINGGLNDPDIHGMTVSAGADVTVFTSTPGEVFASTDTGESWQGLVGFVAHPSRLRYCRGITVKQDDPNTLMVATGESPFGVTGAIQRSTDRGKTWERLALPQEPNTPMWAFATHASDADFILCCSHYGPRSTPPPTGATGGSSCPASSARCVAWPGHPTSEVPSP